MVPLHVRLLGSIAAAVIALASPGPVSAFEKYLPEKTEIVMGINVRQVIESPPIKKYGPTLMAKYWFNFLVMTNRDGFQKLIEDNPGVFQSSKAKGSEQLAAMAEYVSAFFIAGPLDGRDEDMVAIVEGKFDADKAKEFIRLIGSTRFLGLSMKTEKVGGRELYEVVPPRGGKGVFVALADSRHLLFAESKEWLLAALDAAAGDAKPKLRANLLALLGKVDRTQSVWMVGAPVQDFQLEEMTAGIRIDTDIRTEFNVVAKSPDEAQTIAQETKLALLQLSELLKELAVVSRELAPLATVPGEAKVAQNGKVVQFESVIAAPVVENVLEAATKMP
jgi:hypothetical protein